MFALTRRAALLGGALLLPRPALAEDAPWRRLKALEASSGARIGVAAIDTASGMPLFWREGERFLMCSTFKLALAAAVLARADAGREDLAHVVHYSQNELLEVAPATTRNIATGMNMAALCEAAIVDSDGTAANLLLTSVGGPEGLTLWLRGLDDVSTRIDRNEPALNVADGDKDTSTPAAMLGTLKTILLGDALTAASRKRMLDWLSAGTIGRGMLRAGLPKSWAVGDKTGRGRGADSHSGATNDIAIATPPGRPPVLIVCYTQGGYGDDAARQAILAEVGRIAGDAFADARIALR